jgi:N-acetylmuramoyl-L-alanine amidase
MSKQIVLLDPGHGATAFPPKGRFSRPLMKYDFDRVLKVAGGNRHECDAPEYRDQYYREDWGVLEIAKAASVALQDFGYLVFCTRRFKNDVNAKLNLSVLLQGTKWQKRAWPKWKWIRHYARWVKSDAFVSIHTNASRGKASGIVGFYRDDPGCLLAGEICHEINKATQLRIRKLKKRRYAVMGKELAMGGHSPRGSCLIECAFHDHPGDLELLLKRKAVFGKAIAQGIHSHLSSGAASA